MIRSINLLEVKRFEMVDLTKDWSEARYSRRMNYTGKVVSYAGYTEYVSDGLFSLLIEVGDYKAILEFKGIDKIVEEISPSSVPSRTVAKTILTRALDQCELGVFCTCADFKYRFHYVVTQWESLPTGIGGQSTPAKVTNPNEDGFLCKHLTAIVVKPSIWMEKAITLLRDNIIKARGGAGNENL